MTRKVTVIGFSALLDSMRQHAEIVTWPVADRSRLVEAAQFIRRRAPAAVVVATDPAWCEELLSATCFPRGRVLAADDVAAVADAVLGASGAELDVTMRHDGEHGRHGFHRVRARIGAGGVV